MRTIALRWRPTPHLTVTKDGGIPFLCACTIISLNSHNIATKAAMRQGQMGRMTFENVSTTKQNVEHV
jgi:hypothetical protein